MLGAKNVIKALDCIVHTSLKLWILQSFKLLGTVYEVFRTRIEFKLNRKLLCDLQVFYFFLIRMSLNNKLEK